MYAHRQMHNAYMQGLQVLYQSSTMSAVCYRTDFPQKIEKLGVFCLFFINNTYMVYI